MNKPDLIDTLKTIGAVVFVVGVIIVFLIALNFNGGQMESCKEIGMVWVKEYPFGDYGCANVIPVP